MRIALARLTVLGASLLISACGNGSSDSTSNAHPLSISSASPTARTLLPGEEASGATIDQYDAARLAKQASFGPTSKLISAIVAKRSVTAWLDEQFAMSSSSYADIADKPVQGNYCSAMTGTDLTDCNRENFSATPIQMRFYVNAIGKDDQLRQRVAFALSQIIVASEIDVHQTAGLATLQQIFLSNAFGNYRDILKAVTFNAFMGDYLDMVDSNKIQPNENYARELMQIFSIGTTLLNSDGTAQIDGNGHTIPAYSNSDVKEIARALTGWSYARLNNDPENYNNRDWTRPMIQWPSRYDAEIKSFLGRSVAANATQQASVDAVIDAVFNHPNTAPYISKRLIQQLTLANPTSAYIERVAAVFANNGTGVRGDMKAVIRAIYLDPEARTVSQLPGKVKEPVLLATSLARAIGYQTDGYAFTTRDAGMGQAPFRAPSVFNFYPYEFPLPQGAGLLSPVSKLMTTSTTMARHNFLYDWTVGGDGTRGEFKPTLGALGTIPDWTSWEALGTDDKIADRVNLLLLNGTMTKAQRQSMLSAMAAVNSSDLKAQARKRAQVALYIAASSPFFQVDR